MLPVGVWSVKAEHRPLRGRFVLLRPRHGRGGRTRGRGRPLTGLRTPGPESQAGLGGDRAGRGDAGAAKQPHALRRTYARRPGHRPLPPAADLRANSPAAQDTVAECWRRGGGGGRGGGGLWEGDTWGRGCRAWPTKA